MSVIINDATIILQQLKAQDSKIKVLLDKILIEKHSVAQKDLKNPQKEKVPHVASQTPISTSQTPPQNWPEELTNVKNMTITVR